jgi:hypothetical protein
MEIPLQAIKNLVGTDYGYTFDQVNFDTLVFHDGVKRLNKSDYDIEVIRLQVIEDAQLYARNRAADYPSQGDQMDMIYKDTKNSTTTHADAVEAVKTKWPKNNTGPVE